MIDVGRDDEAFIGFDSGIEVGLVFVDAPHVIEQGGVGIFGVSLFEFGKCELVVAIGIGFCRFASVFLCRFGIGKRRRRQGKTGEEYEAQRQ